MTRQRTKVFQLRLTPEEAALFKEKSEPYGSISHYIRCAVVEYSNVHVKQRLELIKELGAFYRKFQNELSWAGGNLNQSVKRANELSVAGLLPPSYVREVLLPTILETQRTLKRDKKGTGCRHSKGRQTLKALNPDTIIPQFQEIIYPVISITR